MTMLLKRVMVPVRRFLLGLGRPSSKVNFSLLQQRGETIDGLTIRDATPDDIPKLAALHVKTWADTYPTVSKPPTYAIREWQWLDAFKKDDGSWFALVVQRHDGALIGFAKGRLSDNPDYAGELNKIYLLREYQRMGLGRRLVGYVARRFLSQGITSMWLYGEADNPSVNAWKALGAEKTDDDPGNGNYGWRDLKKLAEICPVE